MLDVDAVKMHIQDQYSERRGATQCDNVDKHPPGLPKVEALLREWFAETATPDQRSNTKAVRECNCNNCQGDNCVKANDGAKIDESYADGECDGHPNRSARHIVIMDLD